MTDASTVYYSQAGGVVAVTGSIQTFDHTGADGNILTCFFNPALPAGVTVVNTPSFEMDYMNGTLSIPTGSLRGNVDLLALPAEYDSTGQPTGWYGLNYPASKPLVVLNIPPGTPAFTTMFQVGSLNGGGSNAIHFVPVPAAMDVTGTAQLDAAAAKTHLLTAVLRPADGSAATTYQVTAQPNGGFTLPQVPTKSYTLWVKGDKWLAASTPLDLSQGVIPVINLSLLGGDANNDNSVDSTDFGILIGAFNTSASVPGDGYDPSVDFNEDGFVDSSDFGILIGSFNQTGAP